jgi:hypothetical protein
VRANDDEVGSTAERLILVVIIRAAYDGELLKKRGLSSCAAEKWAKFSITESRAILAART